MPKEKHSLDILSTSRTSRPDQDGADRPDQGRGSNNDPDESEDVQSRTDHRIELSRRQAYGDKLAFFYFSAFFDCLEACMKDEKNQMIIESLYFNHGIKNIMVREGAEKKTRNVLK
ncbi:hypothetical protein Fmac_007834 [Flemingia macrophylla]|uniref:Uncharacterized protein n=1 Tax=Flemingia macrophylla TaxID=520843 RepID=A0ABD1MVT0_9FABA